MTGEPLELVERLSDLEAAHEALVERVVAMERARGVPTPADHHDDRRDDRFSPAEIEQALGRERPIGEAELLDEEDGLSR